MVAKKTKKRSSGKSVDKRSAKSPPKRSSHKKSSYPDNETVSQDKILELELELSKLNREKSVIVLNKAIFMYFLFIIVAVIGIISGYKTFFNVLIVMGLAVLVIGTYPYIKTMYDEEKKLKELVSRFKNKKNY